MKESILLSLPRELRDHIYGFALPNDEILHLNYGGHDRGKRANRMLPEPGLLAVSRQVREEGISLFYGRNTIRLPNDNLIGLYLRSLGPERVATINRLSVLIAHGYGRNASTVDEMSLIVIETLNRIRERTVGPVWKALRRDAILITLREDGAYSSKRPIDIEGISISVDEDGWFVERRS